MNQAESLKSRIRKLNSVKYVDGKCVLYVMSRDQRVKDNHALIAAQKHAEARDVPLAVVFCLYDKVENRASEHFEFMLEGLKEVEQDLKKLQIPFLMVIGNPSERLSGVFHHLKPDAVYYDFSPLRGPRQLKKKLAKDHPIPQFVVDTHNVVPVWETSDKLEVGAYTIRPKIHEKLQDYLSEPETVKKQTISWPGEVKTISELNKEISGVINKQKNNNTAITFKSGEAAGLQQLDSFAKNKLKKYAVDRNDPSTGSQSDLSPYLHFGQLSALRVALRMQEEANKLDEELHFLHSPKMPKPEDAEHTKMHGINSLIEELIVRKELADNFCYYEENYDNVSAAPNWAKETIKKHDKDDREHHYTYEELRDAKTHDDAWNAAQKQLTSEGKMHGYMRMYWAKKVKEWTENADIAIEWLIKLNDFYSIDGGDPNGYTGIMWSVVGVHDRPWQERDVFGKIRYMNYGGLKRKFDIEAYESEWL